MRLLDVYSTSGAVDLLWDLLAERTPDQSISHKAMPTRAQHEAFVASRPYAHWYIIEAVTDCIDLVALTVEQVGAVYLTHQREIGIGILKAHRGRRYARNAIITLINQHPGRCLANVNPHNSQSARLFHGLGFELLQVTYARS